MIRRAIPGDEHIVDKFLTPYTESSMFLRGNMRRFGLGKNDHPNATNIYIEETAGGIVGIAGVTNAQMIMIQAPSGVTGLAGFLRKSIDTNRLRGVTGASDQVAALVAKMGLADRPTIIDDVEPLFTLDLEDLCIPVVDDMKLRAPNDNDLPTVAAWRLAYEIEVMGAKETKAAEEEALARATNMIATGDYRLLTKNQMPVGFTGFNTTLPDTVQIGGVYTPPKFRNQGFARKAVALHLDEVKRTGVRRAILFASSAAAAAAYRAIGFKQVGHFTILLFGEP